MKIKLDEKHYLNSDKYCCYITCLCKTESGKTAERRVSGYYTTFEQCVESYINQKVLGSTAGSMTALKADIVKLKKEVRGWKDKVAHNGR